MTVDYERFLIQKYIRWSVYLHTNQCYLGRLYIWSHRSGFVDLMDATEEERDELFVIGNVVKHALTQGFNPDLFNWASLGNLSRQCHMHLIPRYETPREFAGITFTDENWNKNYAPYKSDFEVPESVLFQIRDAIKVTLSEVVLREFRELLGEYFGDDEMVPLVYTEKERLLGEKLVVSPARVRGWRRGDNAPHPTYARVVVMYLKEQMGKG